VLPKQRSQRRPSRSVRWIPRASSPGSLARSRSTASPARAPPKQSAASRKNAARKLTPSARGGSAAAATRPPAGIAVCRTPSASPRSDAGNQYMTARPLAELTLAPAVTAGGIARPDSGHQAVAHVVRDPRGVLLVFEGGNRHDGAEDLLLRNPHRVVDLPKHRR